MDNSRHKMVDQKLENGGQPKRRGRGGRRHPKTTEKAENLEKIESKLSNLKLDSAKSRPRWNRNDELSRSKPEQSRASRAGSISSGYCSSPTTSSGAKSISNSRNSNWNFAAKTLQRLRRTAEPKGLDNPRNYNKIERPLGNESDSDGGWEDPPEIAKCDKSLHYPSARELVKRERDRLMPKIEKIPEDRFAIGDDQWVPRPKFEKNEIFETEEELQMFEDQLQVALHTHEFRDFYSSAVDSAPSPSTSSLSSTAVALLNAYTHHEACQFQAMCAVWKLRPLLVDPYVAEDPTHAIPTVSSVPPGVTVAWYQVIEVEEGYYLARACHLNLTGSLSNVVVLLSSRIEDYGSSVMGELVLGDLLVVHELRRTGFGDENGEMRKTSQCYWQVAKFQVFRREIQKFENLMFFGTRENPRKFLMDVETGRIFEENFEILETKKLKFFDNQESEDKLFSAEIITPSPSQDPRMCTGASSVPREVQETLETRHLAPPTFKPILRILKETKVSTAANLKFWSKNFESTLTAATCLLRTSKKFKILNFKNFENSKIIDRILEPGFFKNLAGNSNGKRIIEAMYGGEGIQAPPTSHDAPPTFEDPYVSHVLHGCPMAISFYRYSVITAAIAIAQQQPEQSIQILLIPPEQSFAERQVFEDFGIRTATFLEDDDEKLSNLSMSNPPQIIICTMDTIGAALRQYPATVSTIQILDGFDVFEADFIWLLANFPDANFGIFAGFQNLKISNPNLAPIFEKFAVGNFVERAVDEECCPVFRCEFFLNPQYPNYKLLQSTVIFFTSAGSRSSVIMASFLGSK